MKRFGLSAEERIKSKIDFDMLYSAGKVIFSDNRKIKAIYLVKKNNSEGNIMITVAVSSKAGKAVWRNRLKRLFRAAYRLNKENLLKLCLLKNIVLKIIFSPNQINEKNHPKIKLNDIMPGVKDILFQLERSL
ncbi:MAG TPA: ribonuclease P protein component [Ignavibacteriaceae bacterium]|nr:ribonuclease P protein component [Ignavibacteriaceae bacterium]